MFLFREEEEEEKEFCKPTLIKDIMFLFREEEEEEKEFCKPTLIKKDTARRTLARKILVNKICNRNLIEGINSWTDLSIQRGP